VPLGQILESYGGGGHQRVAGVVVPDAIDPNDSTNDSSTLLSRIVDEIREADRILQQNGLRYA
jgi:nanoRNase/pAp phosphatase (c-di-AMP/oligoRNAs hydrolase)